MRTSYNPKARVLSLFCTRNWIKERYREREGGKERISELLTIGTVQKRSKNPLSTPLVVKASPDP